MLCRDILKFALVAGALSIASTAAPAFSPDDMQIAAEVYDELRAQGFDVSNFESLTLSQIALLKGELENGSNAQLINGVLSGACGGSVILSADQLRELMN